MCNHVGGLDVTEAEYGGTDGQEWGRMDHDTLPPTNQSINFSLDIIINITP
jgi:hypothetical protein